MKIGALIINLDENGKDCLHFTGISIPEELIRLNINEICGEIE